VISPGLAGLAVDGTPEELNPEAARPERLFNARSSLETLTRMAAYAGTVRNRRKALVLIGEGIDYQFGSQDDNSREIRDQYRSFVGAANRANLVVYAFDPRVYSQMGDDFVDIASTPPGDMEAGQEKIKTGQLQDAIRASQDNLRALSVETGGFALVASQSFLPAFDRVRVENSNYYMLGYTPTNQAQDGAKGLHRPDQQPRRAGARPRRQVRDLGHSAPGPRQRTARHRLHDARRRDSFPRHPGKGLCAGTGAGQRPRATVHVLGRQDDRLGRARGCGR